MTQAAAARTASVNRRCVRQPWEGCRHFLTYQHVLAGKLPAFLLVGGCRIPHGDWPNRRERCGHWLHASSERNIRHSNRAVILLSRRSAAGLRCPWAARVHGRPPLVVGRGAAGRPSRRRTMPSPVTSRPLWAVRVRRFSLGRRSGSGRDAWPDKGRGGAWEEEVRAAGPSAPTPRRGTAGTAGVLSGWWARRRRGNIPRGRASRPRPERRLYVVVPGAAGGDSPPRARTRGWSRRSSGRR